MKRFVVVKVIQEFRRVIETDETAEEVYAAAQESVGEEEIQPALDEDENGEPANSAVEVSVWDENVATQLYP